MRPTQALKRRLEGCPPLVGVPRQPPPTSLDEIHNHQMFRQRSEGRENPVLPPKPLMPRKGSKQSLVHAVRRKTSETTDPEVWGSDFQEVVTEDSGRMVAIYSYNGEEPGTLQIQPGQQFRLISEVLFCIFLICNLSGWWKIIVLHFLIFQAGGRRPRWMDQSSSPPSNGGRRSGGGIRPRFLP